MTYTRDEIDREFAKLGATHFLHSHYPNQTHWVTGAVRQGRVFSVHYFNAEGTEIGYWIPDLAEFSGAHILETPREWPRMKLADNLRRLKINDPDYNSGGSMRHFGSDRGLA